MSQDDLQLLLGKKAAAPWRLRLAAAIESPPIQTSITVIILLNAVVLGLQTDRGLGPPLTDWLGIVDAICLTVFVAELTLKLLAYRGIFWRSGWNIFDFVVVSIALVPGSGPLAVLRSLRVLRVLRLLTVVPQMRRVVAAFFHSIPGLTGVVAIMATFYYTAGVLATSLFGETHPQWFGSLGDGLYTLFQIMTLESWSMGIVRPLMEAHPWAWAFFVPFIVVATFTILNLFIGIIVSTMQELGTSGFDTGPETAPELVATLERLEHEIRDLRLQVAAERRGGRS